MDKNSHYFSLSPSYGCKYGQTLTASLPSQNFGTTCKVGKWTKRDLASPNPTPVKQYNATLTVNQRQRKLCKQNVPRLCTCIVQLGTCPVVWSIGFTEWIELQAKCPSNLHWEAEQKAIGNSGHMLPIKCNYTVRYVSYCGNLTKLFLTYLKET